MDADLLGLSWVKLHVAATQASQLQNSHASQFLHEGSEPAVRKFRTTATATSDNSPAIAIDSVIPFNRPGCSSDSLANAAVENGRHEYLGTIRKKVP